ncbi:heterogeneous nuclear ribonucleoprotein A2 homolog 1-like [Anthonomus grandis grandis]|uniref:heterogeneous nuclear ribonucleoprotein A2 homolog 1-like n=1 Tax=Anthonomus grandis grandis TaxID=2921223 RepID=UPI0021658447|nr:heterogeneous nuclear ribonucleoprotein A2 homolog 1-like [Anthonomus grandis grandis]
MNLLITFLTFLTLNQCHALKENSSNSPSGVLQKFFQQCSDKEELIKCLKVQAVKVADRALHLRSFNVVDGLNIVGNARMGRAGLHELNTTKLEKLSHDELDSLIGDRATRFLDTHKVEVNISKLLKEETGRSFTEEARRGGGGGGGSGGGGNSGGGKGGGKKGGGGGGGGYGGYGALMAALAIKGSFLALAYKGIAIMSGTAILIGKMALILAAILGLKKLVSNNNEKTTFEIIKTPKYTEEHVHTSEHEDEHSYRRNYLDNSEVQRRVYRFQIPED